jgi:toxin ParE1/3/4
MARSIVWAENAISDIDETAAFIARDSKLYAKAVLDEAFRSASMLSDFANRGRVVPEFGNANIRELIVLKYRLIYLVADDRVTILGFIHGARQLPGALNQEVP